MAPKRNKRASRRYYGMYYGVFFDYMLKQKKERYGFSHDLAHQETRAEWPAFETTMIRTMKEKRMSAQEAFNFCMYAHEEAAAKADVAFAQANEKLAPVSYTHLTLPTILLV